MANGSMINNENQAQGRVVALVLQLLNKRGSLSLPPIRGDQKLHELGLTSMDLARLALLVEDEFGLRIPAHDLVPANFRSISAIAEMVSRLADSKN
jgi:acyl carrier protein